MTFELLFYVVIGSGALLARFGKKKFSFKSTAEVISLNSQFSYALRVLYCILYKTNCSKRPLLDEVA